MIVERGFDLSLAPVEMKNHSPQLQASSPTYYTASR